MKKQGRSIMKCELTAVLLASVVTLAACGGSAPAPASSGQTAAAPPAGANAGDEIDLPPSELESRLPSGMSDIVLKPFTGDLDEMVKRRVVRIGVTYNRTFYFVDKGVPRGVAYEYGQLIEQRLNEHFKTDNATKVHVVLMPLPRDLLASALI